MTRHSFTLEGAAALHAELLEFDIEQQQDEAVQLLKNPIGWLASRFELTVQQLELLRALDAPFMQCIGVGLSGAVIARRPFLFKGWDTQPARSVPKRVIIINTICVTYEGLAGFTADGEVTITLVKG
jgi:hypothetical protein